MSAAVAVPASSLVEQALPMAAALCREFEGLRLKPYLCPAGVPTIGYGSTRYEDGAPVRLSDPQITRERAESMLRLHLQGECLPAVLRLVPTADTPGRVAALADFVFNLGAGRLEQSTLRRKALAGDWSGVEAELLRWVMSGGKRLDGLLRRRRAEIELLGV